MAKIIIFTDIHGETQNLLRLEPIIEGANAALFLGDGIRSLEILSGAARKKLTVVRGNCDTFADMFARLPSELQIEVAGKRIFMTHGHNYDVKSTASVIQKKAAELAVHVCVYGHTHKYKTWEYGGILFINVPTIGTKNTDQPGRYVELVIDGDKISHFVKKV